MKAFIYVSVLLITAGSAFGLADYLKEKNKGTFNKLYVEEPMVMEEEPAVAPVDKGTAQPAIPATAAVRPVATKATPVKKMVKKAPRRAKISFREFSRSAMPAPVPEELEPIQPAPVPAADKPVVKEDAPVAVEVPAPVQNIAEEKPSLRRLYSRAPMPRKKAVAVKPPVVVE